MPLNAILILMFFIGVPLVMMVQMWRQYQFTQRLQEHGLHARGKVLRVRTSWLNSKYRIVEYVFFLPDGSEIAGEYKEQRSLFRSHGSSAGDLLEVLYLPDNPHLHQRVGAEMGLLATLTGIFGMVVFTALAIIFILNAPAKQAPQTRGPPPSNKLRNYDEASHSRPPATRPQRQLGAY
ncbi:DUF3592 domain-containing protein [Corallococcus sp. AB049A]|uniref:DUF3592 domain-containing protein n=1 Tax=Corallococcus sp. AB049A TaxID=2316721 RepID=UPI000EBC8079|nr:DUF3592 domain-containing protein [Corallococcus sp. AB049A]RKI52249.1 DUF3592 domain-containing protein [Corallococcus sp. AB049A]